MYFQKMGCIIHKIPVELPKPLSLNKRRKGLLHAIGGEWWMNKMNENLPPPKKIKLIIKAQEKEGEIKNKSANSKSKLEWLEISDTLE